MPRRSGRAGPSRSLFASLPPTLKQTLRSQVLDPLADKAEEVRIKAEQILEVSVGGLLGTQPVSEDETSDIELEVEDEVTRADERIVLGVTTTAEATAGTSEVIQLEKERSTSELPTASSIVKSIRREQPIASSSSTSVQTPNKRPSSPVYENALSSKKRRKGNAATKKVVVNPYLDHPWDCTGLVPRYSSYDEVPPDLTKYYAQRHLLLPQYDTLPLLLDHTGWFSITPQSIAAHIAQRCACDLIVDAFCGVGGNAIEFAKTCERVIAIDNDLTRLKLARHNALHHGVADRIEFILGDFTEFARTYAARDRGESIDVVFLSPPWGGIDYLNTPSPTFPLSAILPIHGSDLFNLTSTLTPNIAYYLPRNVDMQEIGALARPLEAVDEVGRKREWVEVEEEWVGGKVKAVTAYYGGLVADD
ncbi:hypothetical protein CI109_104718 [Kwoniella shandongensis]|uniref:Trimethylguanosine synthase n=1 Tax=Kwoniella shandongensis TaxID=1734106 RepID=A0A5M6BRL3_9TREE|nr:uncharacterized protein CI109_006970 [Kwoniella shandongensis]KAA5524712.1 hypothetical protein CI109_006970 [Kwoniella shandongensis]